MNVSQPKYIRHDDVSRSAIGSVLSTCIGSLGLSSVAPPLIQSHAHNPHTCTAFSHVRTRRQGIRCTTMREEPALRHKIQELRGYCSHLETENDMLILQVLMLCSAACRSSQTPRQCCAEGQRVRVQRDARAQDLSGARKGQ